MENKEMASAGKISQRLMGYWLLWGLLFGLIYSFSFALISNLVESIVVKVIIAVIAQGGLDIIVWKLSTSSAFKKRTMSKTDVPTVMRNLIIFTIIVCIFTGIYNFFSANTAMDEAINSNYKLKLYENMMSRVYSDEQMAEYNKEKAKLIADAKKQANTYVIMLEIGLAAVYLGVLVLEKKEILKYVS